MTPQDFLHELGVTPSVINKLRRMPFQQAQAKLEEIKTVARRQYRRLALKYHPDRNLEDPEGAQQSFILLGNVLQYVESLKVQPPVPPPMRRPVMHVSFPFTSTTSTSSTTTGTYSTYSYFGMTGNRPRPVYNARRVIFVRPL